MNKTTQTQMGDDQNVKLSRKMAEKLTGFALKNLANETETDVVWNNDVHFNIQKTYEDKSKREYYIIKQGRVNTSTYEQKVEVLNGDGMKQQIAKILLTVLENEYEVEN